MVNLIANKEVVQELMAERFRINNIVNEVYKLLPNKPARQTMLDDYKTMQEKWKKKKYDKKQETKENKIVTLQRQTTSQGQSTCQQP